MVGLHRGPSTSKEDLAFVGSKVGSSGYPIPTRQEGHYRNRPLARRICQQKIVHKVLGHSVV